MYFNVISSPEFHITENDANTIKHIALPIGKNVIMANDVPESIGHTNETKIEVKFQYVQKAKKKQTNYLMDFRQGGQIEVLIGDSPWGSYFGMFKNKYGIE